MTVASYEFVLLRSLCINHLSCLLVFCLLFSHLVLSPLVSSPVASGSLLQVSREPMGAPLGSLSGPVGWLFGPPWERPGPIGEPDSMCMRVRSLTLNGNHS